MRVALLHPTYWPEVRRGSERVVHDLGVALKQRGHDVTVLTSHPGAPASGEEDGLEVRRAWRPPRLPGLRLHEYHLESAPLTALRLLAGTYDVAHAFFPTDAWAAVRARRLGGPRVIFSMHGIPLREYLVARRGRLGMLRETVAGAAECSVLSEAARTPFRDYLLRDPLVMPGGVDTQAFATDTPRSGAPTILCPASLGDPRKRGALLFEAFNALRAERPDVSLRVLRTPDPVMSAHPLELPAGAEWVDAETTEQLSAAYASAWVSVLPAVHEAFGLVLIESLAAGTPVVAARSGAVPEIVTSKAIGSLFEPDDASALRAALQEGLEVAERRGVAGRCRKRAKDFDWSLLAARWEEIYSGALPASRAGTAAINEPAS